MSKIKFLEPDELPRFRHFLEMHWRRNHALSVSPALMDWMYKDHDGSHYHFVVSESEDDGSLEAVLGFLPLTHFDPTLGGGDLWLQLWKVRDDRRGAGLGSKLFLHLKQKLQPRSVCGFGLSEGVKPTYARLGFTLGMMNHYFLASPAITDFKLLSGWQPEAAPAPSAEGIELVPLDQTGFDYWTARLDWDGASQQVPRKSAAYFRARYLQHPIYRYEMLAVTRGTSIFGIVVLRRVTHRDSAALKWIDYYGDFESLALTAGYWPELLRHYGAEYVEFHNLGIPSGILARAGFTRRLPGSSTIVPSYFEPFERRNVDIAYAHWTWSDARYCIFKGDSDQDRPTLIPGVRRAEVGTAIVPEATL